MPNSTEIQPKACYDLTATITSGGTTSAAVDITGCTLAGLFIPSTFDGTTLTIQAATTINGTYATVQDTHSSSSAYTITTAAGQYVPIDNLAILAGLRFVKFVAGTTQTTTDTVLTLALRPV